MRRIELVGASGRGLAALVDDADFECLAAFRWHCGRGYAQRAEYLGGPNYATRTVYMHREILGAKSGELVDHADMDKLNNTRANLRLCTRAQNALNTRRRPDNTSGIKGVTWSKRHGKWYVQIQADGRKRYLGMYENLHDAGVAYARGARAFHGEFARTQ